VASATPAEICYQLHAVFLQRTRLIMTGPKKSKSDTSCLARGVKQFADVAQPFAKESAKGSYS